MCRPDRDDATSSSSEDSKTKFRRGDHVYQWCSVVGVPRVYQHHGIVMHVEVLISDVGKGEVIERLTIADFSNFLPESSGSSSSSPAQGQSAGEGSSEAASNSTASEEPKCKWRVSSKESKKSAASFVGGGESTGGILRIYTTTSADCPWKKVEYNAPRWKTVFHRSGISTSMDATDCAEVVLSRVNFLLCHESAREANDTFRSSALPQYHLIFANCECVAMWAKTGRFCTLQGASLLTGTAATWAYSGGVGTMAIRQAPAAEEVTASLASAFPGLVRYLGSATAISTGALTASGAVAIGGCTITFLMARSRWNATTERLNEAFDGETIRATTGISMAH